MHARNKYKNGALVITGTKLVMMQQSTFSFILLATVQQLSVEFHISAIEAYIVVMQSDLTLHPCSSYKVQV